MTNFIIICSIGWIICWLLTARACAKEEPNGITLLELFLEFFLWWLIVIVNLFIIMKKTKIWKTRSK